MNKLDVMQSRTPGALWNYVSATGKSGWVTVRKATTSTVSVTLTSGTYTSQRRLSAAGTPPSIFLPDHWRRETFVAPIPTSAEGPQLALAYVIFPFPIVRILEMARRSVATTVSAGLTLLYWRIGKRIVDKVLGRERAVYGQQIVVSVAQQLVQEYGPSFGEKNLRPMMQFARGIPHSDDRRELSTPDSASHSDCTTNFQHSSDAVSLSRTTMIQPGVYYTLEAPLVRILSIFSNMLENPGIISSTKNPTKRNQPTYQDIPDIQLDYLEAAFQRVQTQNFAGAVILAVHHPPYTFGKHLKSAAMLKEIDAICQRVGVWPHAMLSSHAHCYKRYTRTLKNGRQTPYVVW
jgi:DUF1016 N-terminal domain